MAKHYRPPGKKKEGNASRYITRSQAVKYLQISLSLFRKLCILKGIFPREPKKKVKGNHHSYYHTKDILFLKHEPLLEKFRDMRAYEKKVKKAVSKKNRDLAERLLTREPTYSLDMLIRERYSKFIDALRDLDDCLTMVHLFAALPATESEKIQVKRIHNCQRLSHAWQVYISRTHKLRKTFISVKGIYYQAEIEGQKITWLTPHSLQQVLPESVDYNVMLTFLEFYEVLLGFVKFSLYQSINICWSPTVDITLEDLAAGQYASRYFDDANSRATLVGSQAASLSGSNQVADHKEGKNPDEAEFGLAKLPSSEPGALMHLVHDVAEDEDDKETRECKILFKNMTFFLSREVPKESLLFVILAFGGVVSWEEKGAPFEESDGRITHQIADRPTQSHKFLSREYVQPQWVYDCVNARVILPTEEYMVGRVPPPHLSPFVDNEAEGYVPEYAETIKRMQAAARKEVLPIPGVGEENLDDPQNLLVEGIINRTEAIEAADRKRKMSSLQKQYHDELKSELQGVQNSFGSKTNKEKSNEETEAGEESLPDLEQVTEDATNMSKVLMSRKKRRLFEAMQICNERKRANVGLLKERKRKIDNVRKSE